MSKAILMSIQPKWCELIISGDKTIEVRKTRPKIYPPFKCYIYCTKEQLLTKSHYNGKIYISHETKYQDALERSGNITLSGYVIGEFTCNLITGLKANNGIQTYYNGIKETCLTDAEIIKYASGKMIYYWHISDLVIYDEPKELGEFWHDNKCPYFSQTGCSYQYHCFRAGENNGKYGRCGETLTHPPQSWCYVEELSD